MDTEFQTCNDLIKFHVNNPRNNLEINVRHFQCALAFMQVLVSSFGLHCFVNKFITIIFIIIVMTQ